MIKSEVRRHRQATQSDKHLIVGGLENIMADGRGKVRPFGLSSPKTAPTLEVKEGGELRRDTAYSYLYTHYDSYHDAESEVSPATAYKRLDGDIYKSVSVGRYTDDGNYELNFIRVQGDNLSKVDGYYVGKCIAAKIENDDRPTPYSQRQWRKVTEYNWNGDDNVGEFTVSRDFFNVDSNAEDQEYEVRISDMDMEEGDVGGQVAGNNKLILDPSASTDTASYRLKAIRITQGKGKGQSRFIIDASLNSDGLVEITVNKPWGKKPRYVDPTKRSAVKAQTSVNGKPNLTNKFYNENWSSSYVIYDPLRYNGLCFDGEVESRDKKTGRITIAGLGSLESILNGNVIRFLKGTAGASKMVISLNNSDPSADWTEDNSLKGKRIKITGGPGAGKEYVITGSEASGDNSVKVTLGMPRSEDDTSNIGSGTPTAKSTYVVFTDNAVSEGDLATMAGVTPKASVTLEAKLDESLDYDNVSGLLKDGVFYITIVSTSVVERYDLMKGGIMKVNPYTVKTKKGVTTKIPQEKDKFTDSLSVKEILEISDSGTGLFTYIFTMNQKPSWWGGKIKSQQVGGIWSATASGTSAEYTIKDGVDGVSLSIFSDADGDVTVRAEGNNLDLGDVDLWSGKKVSIWPMWNINGAWAEALGKSELIGVAYGTKSAEGTLVTYEIALEKAPTWLYSTKIDGHQLTAKKIYGLSLFSDYSELDTVKEGPGADKDITRIYINDKQSTGLASLDANSIDGSYAVTMKVHSIKGKGKLTEATISRLIHAIGTEDGRDYIDVIGTMPRLYDRPRKKNTDSTDNAPQVMKPYVDEPLTIHASATRDGFYAGWMAMFYNTTELGGNKQKIKCKNARVIASFDATGEIVVDKEIAGVKEGWQCVLYSEYTDCLGSCVNSAEKSIFYRNGYDDLGIYSDYVPLEPFASSEDEAYEGWTMEVLTKTKVKRNGQVKIKKASDTYRKKQKRTVIKYYGASRRAFVYMAGAAETWDKVQGDAYYPLLGGSEFVWLYDPATHIDKIFEDESEDSTSNDTGVKIVVSGLRRCPYDGVDKIRLYRANEHTGAYLHVVDLENKNQDYTDDTPEEHLTHEIDIGNVPPPPAKVCCEYKTRFILGGAVESKPKTKLVRDSYPSVYVPDYGMEGTDPNPIIEGYLYTDGEGFTAKAVRVAPAAGILCNENCGTVISPTSDTNTEELKVNLVISNPSQDGIIMWCERKQFSGVFQRSRVSGSHDDKMGFEAVDGVYLSVHASSLASDYEDSVLSFAAYDKVAQLWPFTNRHLGSEGKWILDSRYTAKNRNFRWQDSVKVTVPTISNTVYPTPFTIKNALWVFYRKGGKFWLKDVKNAEPKEIEVTLDSNFNIAYATFTANQGETYTNIRYRIGGNHRESVSARLYGWQDETSTQFRLYSAVLSLPSDSLLGAYLGGEATEMEYDRGSTKDMPVLSTPECINNSEQASTYTSTGQKPTNPPIKELLMKDGKVVMVAVWDKTYKESTALGQVTLTARENATAVFCTKATTGDKEKTDLANSFVFNDDLGTDITGLASWRDFVVVFKQRGMYSLDPDAPAIKTLSNDIGCIATDSIVRGRSGIYWMAEGRRLMRSNFQNGAEYIGAPVQPWFDGLADFDGWECKDGGKDMLATYDVDSDEYIMFIPATKDGNERMLCLIFCDQHGLWYRLEDDNASGHSDNACDCAFRFEGRMAFCGSRGIYVNSVPRSEIAAWFWKSVQRDETNSGLMKHVKRIQIINKVDHSLVGDPTAKMEFYKEMEESPEGSYQAEDAHTQREFYTNRFSQLIHIGLRALMWQFRMFGTAYVKIHDFVLQLRPKGEAEVGNGDTPN